MTEYTFPCIPVYSDSGPSENQSLTIRGLTGLVGRNGAGKSRLLSYLQQSSGDQQRIGYLPQVIEADSGVSVAEMLGVGELVAATERLSAGTGSEHDLTLLECKWHVPDAARELLNRIGLSTVSFDRPDSTLSGGQRVLVRFAAVMLQQPDILLLDEPTNNLDRNNRARLIQFLKAWKRPALIASHDRELLSAMEHIVEIEAGRLIHYGGGFELYHAAREASFSESERKRELARREILAIEREKQIRSERAARRAGIGKKKRATGSQPKVAADWKKNRAESGMNRSAGFEDARLADAVEALGRARAMRMRGDRVAFNLERMTRPDGNTSVVLEGISFRYSDAATPVFSGLSLYVRFGERIALEAENGRGKSTLLRIIAGLETPNTGSVIRPSGRVVLIDQHCQLVDRDRTVLQQFRNLEISSSDLRQGLAQFLFKGEILERCAGLLSGGEVLRLALAMVFIGQEPPALLLFDEPTNHVDLETVEVLEHALNGYDGTLIVASHDVHFRDAIGLQQYVLGD